ncbi:MAG: type II secretion system GspH family protein [Oscillospiraceae bacterium]|nr:type II secretion system GspH family protein [Oscillospiraceae bacterium]
MMKNKNIRGVTLTELIICIAILATVMTIAGAALFDAFHSYAITTKIQEDEYNLRMAALSISRQIRHGVNSDTPIVAYLNNLEFTMHDGKKITYVLSEEGMLTRTGDSAVPFVAVKLSSFDAVYENGRIKLTLISEQHGTEVKMTVAVNRVRS